MTKTFSTRPAKIDPAVHTVSFSEEEVRDILIAHMRALGPVPRGAVAIWGFENDGYGLEKSITLQITETPDDQ